MEVNRGVEKRKHGVLEEAELESPVKLNAKQRRAAAFKDFKKEYQGEKKGQEGSWRGQLKLSPAAGKKSWKQRRE